MPSPSEENSSGTEEAEQGWEVKIILDERWKNGKHQYYVKWKDQIISPSETIEWSKDEHNEWLNEENMDCPEMIAEFKERRAGDERRRARRAERKKDRSTPSGKKDKKDKTPRRGTDESSKQRDDDDDDIPRSSRKKKKKKRVVISDEDDEPSTSKESARVEKKGHELSASLDDQPCSSSSLRPPASSRTSRDPPISSSPTSQMPIPSLKIKTETDPFEFMDNGAEPRSHMDSSDQLQKLRKEKKDKGEKMTTHQKVKRKGKALVVTSTMEDEQTKDTTTPLFKSNIVKMEMEKAERMDMSYSEDPSERMYTAQPDEPNEMEESMEMENDGVAVSKPREETTGTKEEGEKGGEEGERFLTGPDSDENHGYLDGHEGRIVSHEKFIFDNGTKDTFFRVVFVALEKSFWIRYDIVREYDPTGYRMYMRELIQRDKAAKIAEGAKRYHAYHAERAARETRDTRVEGGGEGQ